MTVTLEAPSCSSTAHTVAEAPPLPSTSTFLPATAMPLWATIPAKP